MVQVLLKSRPKGWPSEENFEFVEVDLHQPEKGSGDVLVQILWLSVDPYLRGRCDSFFWGRRSGSAASVRHVWPAGLQSARMGPDTSATSMAGGQAYLYRSMTGPD